MENKYNLSPNLENLIRDDRYIMDHYDIREGFILLS